MPEYDTGYGLPMVQFANMGFDIWLSNPRGSRYGNTHDTLDYNTKEFWDFTPHEMGRYDITLQVQKIYEMTGRKVSMLGFSQGTTTVLNSIAMVPEVHREITNVAGVMSPCGIMSELNSKELYVKEFVDFLNENDIWTIAAGPNWDENLQKIKDFSDVLYGNVIYYDMATNDEPIATKVLFHYA